jgi:23S rRNA-/tRNA-specific pseudouridylate synthase
VHGVPKLSADTIKTYLAENKAHVVYSTSDPAKGRLAITAYRVLRKTKDLALLEIDLLTGRKNQIRVHLAGIGHPIVGDHKYGLPGDSHARLALHAHTISFRHPITGEPVTFAARIPNHLNSLVAIA